ncbi:MULTISPECIES: serine/threonine-protein kinase [Myxococcus]|uniref:serine/threonine-protein kinase n=1 Tax=Myxococcus TaxID=32 RepID=UPI0002E661CC|nr:MULTISPECIES: serine/threonine-protein kinase [Myxococcus]NOJ54973.1 serine/threonine protein kinase [Myxococcus xanthus]QPM82775.1 serine/threonine protein kinase [Myxococcus xanthus]QVW65080.1 serine/threonine protein kinase [Myxococcus xanthus DZ2]UEO01850.1 protein kinase [Myxococcus xanthus DZ2]UYI17953.1 protein kinase [Myxococcus xanthus]
MAAPCPHCGSTDGVDHLCSGQGLQLLGQVLDGRYKIESVLGQGGMGMVFRATQTSVQRPVAVKTLNPSLAAAPQFFERFRREAELASRLRHPNVITIFDFGRSPDGTCYYVMELLEGESLKETVKRQGPMSLRRALSLVEQASQGLAHAHAEGCVHRDLKPHNIMVQQLSGQDFVKVLDFGLVKAMESEEEEQLTSTGQVLGTPQYMPPEQAGGESVDQRSDLYSMAGVLYFCLTGSSPFGANTVRKALTASLTQAVPAVNTKRQGAPVPAALDAFFKKALAPEKEDRYQNAQEFIDAMLDTVADLTSEELDAMPSGGVPSASERGSNSRSRSSRQGSQSGIRSSRVGAAPSLGRGATPSNVVVARPQGGASGSSSSPSRVRSQTSRSAPPPPPPPPEPEGMSTGKKVALVAVPLVLLGIGAAVVLGKPGGSAPATPVVVNVPRDAPPATTQTATGTTGTPEEASVLTVSLDSTPSGASIYEGEEMVGTTPTKLQLRRDKVHSFSFRLPGHQDKELTLNLRRVAGDTQSANVVLEPVRAAAPGRSPRPPPKPASPSGPDISVFE